MRTASFGQDHRLSLVDRWGIWLSKRQITRWTRSFQGKVVGDFGCGFQATFCRTILDEVQQAYLVDVALAPDLKAHPKVLATEGTLPGAIASIPEGALDIVMLISVLEHVAEPQELLCQLHRVLKPGGTAIINVPSWAGKVALEFSAFRLGTSPAAEMDDHKMYYDPRDLWPLLVRAGFRPSQITCFRHKLGLNTFAVCRKTELA